MEKVLNVLPATSTSDTDDRDRQRMPETSAREQVERFALLDLFLAADHSDVLIGTINGIADKPQAACPAPSFAPMAFSWPDDGWFTSHPTIDTITDFRIGEDCIDLSDVLDSVGYHGADPLADGVLSIVQQGHDTVLLLHAGDTDIIDAPTALAVLQNVAADEIAGQLSSGK